MMIDQGTIERVMETANSQIVDVVSEFVSLKRRGINYIGNCPFHNEKTPSFIVSPHKGICKCFGCGKGGNAVNFIMEHEQITFPEAIKYLGQKFHIEVEDVITSYSIHYTKLYECSMIKFTALPPFPQPKHLQIPL